MVEAQKATAENLVGPPDSDRMKEALRRLASSAGEEIVGEIESFIEGLEETVAAKSNRISEMEDEMEEMIPCDAIEEAQEKLADDVWRNLARVHRFLKAGKVADALEELEITLNRNHSDWRMYVS